RHGRGRVGQRRVRERHRHRRAWNPGLRRAPGPRSREADGVHDRLRHGHLLLAARRPDGRERRGRGDAREDAHRRARHWIATEIDPLSAIGHCTAENVPLSAVSVVPVVSVAVNWNGPYWQVGGLAGLSKIVRVEPMTSPTTSPLMSFVVSAYTAAHVPVTESPVCVSANETALAPSSASDIDPDQSPETLNCAGAVVDLAAHAATAIA